MTVERKLINLPQRDLAVELGRLAPLEIVETQRMTEELIARLDYSLEREGRDEMKGQLTDLKNSLETVARLYANGDLVCW